MTGQAHWFPIFLIAGTGAAIFVVWRIMRRVDRGLREVKTQFTCPATGRTVEVLAVQERATGYYTGIRSCSAFERTGDVRCSQTCVKALNVEAASRPAPFATPAR
jgi:hypothetical protein